MHFFDLVLPWLPVIITGVIWYHVMEMRQTLRQMHAEQQRARELAQRQAQPAALVAPVPVPAEQFGMGGTETSAAFNAFTIEPKTKVD